MLLKSVKFSLLLGLTISSSVLCAAEQDIFEILLNGRTKSLKIKLDRNENIGFWYDSYNGLELDYFKNYTDYYNKKNVSISIDYYFKFINIPGGSFDMGSPPNEQGRFDDEGLIRNIKISDFSVQTTQVTQFQYWLVTKSNPSAFNNKDYCRDEHVTFNGVSMCPNHPVETVSWDDAQLFIQSLNEKSDDYTYSLPTEAQWEYAARAGTTTRYSFGDDEENLAGFGWYYKNSKNQTHQVASLKSNGFGLSDIHGNVWEWVQDSWLNSSDRFFKKTQRNLFKKISGWLVNSPARTEEDLRGSLVDPVFENNSPDRVFRGGSWYYYPQILRSAIRNGWRSVYRYSSLGLRLVRTPK